jgi:peptidoglycan/xylan/chitin deacetylase (PgdA/CDA1 family)
MLGAHTHSHLPLARLDADQQRREFEANLQVLERAAGRRPAIVSYPYGSLDAVDPSVAASAAAAGLVAGFTMERAFNRSLEQPLLLARLDCVDAPGGRRPLFAADDALGPGSTLAPNRERYLDEAALVRSANASA